MSLPYDFECPLEYFKQTLAFLHQYSWIYEEANTRFIKAGVLEMMPPEFREYFQEIDNDHLNNFPYVHQRLEIPNKPILYKFRQQLARLIPQEAFMDPSECEIHINLTNFKKMNLKKQHEIQRLAHVIHQQLMRSANERYCLIDFGCGLGYLSEILFRLNENFLILGLDSDLYRVEAAEKRLKTYMPQAENAIHYRQQFITENSQNFIKTSVQELFQSNYNATSTPTSISCQDVLHRPNAAIIGLHACADLTITSMKLFLRMPQVSHLIIMPCCYHKLQMCETSLKFHNFPLSRSVREVLTAESGDTDNYVAHLNRPFLRLACQQTLKRWQKCSVEQHETHGRTMFLRAVAEALTEETEVVVQSKEKVDLRSQTVLDFDTLTRFYHLKSKLNDLPLEWSECHRIKFNALMKKYPNGGKLAEGLTCLQTSMQKLCENFVLYDRLCFMQEAASDLNLKLNVRYEKLMDEELSPRCYVLIAEKV